MTTTSTTTITCLLFTLLLLLVHIKVPLPSTATPDPGRRRPFEEDESQEVANAEAVAREAAMRAAQAADVAEGQAPAPEPIPAPVELAAAAARLAAAVEAAVAAEQANQPQPPPSPPAEPLPPGAAHLFVLRWPPAEGRVITRNAFYRWAFPTADIRRREMEAAGIRREALQPTPPTDPTVPDKAWALQLWVPPNCSLEREAAFGPTEEARRERSRREAPLQNAKIRELERLYGDVWLKAAAVTAKTETARRRKVNALYRARWDQMRAMCGLSSVTEYFRIAAETVRGRLRVGEWLAEQGIRPRDERGRPRGTALGYRLDQVKLAIARELLAGDVEEVYDPGRVDRAFQLFCVDMNQVVVAEEAEEQGFVHPYYGPPTMLHSILLCVDPRWPGPHIRLRYVPCPAHAFGWVQNSMLVPCPGPVVAYYRTLNDGIDGPFLDQVEEGGGGGGQ